MVILLGWVLGLPLPSAGHAPPPGGAQDEETSFRLEVDVDLVVLNVTVMDASGTNVTSLTREDFTVYEDGVRQDISTFFPVEAPFKLVLLVDTSISTRNNLKLIKDAARNFTKELRPDDQISVTETHFFTREVQKFTNNRKLLRRGHQAVVHLSLRRLPGLRRRGHGAQEPATDPQRPQGHRGAQRRNGKLQPGQFRGIAQAVGQDDAVFYPITILNKDRQKEILERYIRDNQEKEEDPYVENARLSLSVLEEVYQIQTERLIQLSGDSGGKMFLVADLSDLTGEYSKVAHELRHTFSLAYYSNNLGHQGGMRRVRVEMKDPRLRVRTRTAYYVSGTSRPGS